ncbi:helix-turn-helix domain-containing protein [Paenibacillaceae bacterium WGS1546]|uniref:AraC family transcriptional regulator n=1 Tax=Cohnella sp. WGS1546 TaxID=3366810 RepID=UPI00372D8179
MSRNLRKDELEILTQHYFCVTELEKSSAVWPVRMGVDVLPSNRRVGPKVVPHFYLIFVQEGQGELIYRQQTYSLKKSGLFCLFPQASHEYYAVGDGPMRKAWIAFEGPQGYRMLERIGIKACTPYIPNALHAGVEELFNRMLETAGDPEGRDMDLSRLIAFFRLFEELSRKTPDSLRDKVCSDNWLLQGKEYIETHYCERITVETVADRVRVDRAHFTRRFHQAFGITPAKYLLELKINEARRLLENSDFNLTVIAQSIGYTDMFTFSKSFKKLAGVSPKEYRNRTAGENRIMSLTRTN